MYRNLSKYTTTNRIKKNTYDLFNATNEGKLEIIEGTIPYGNILIESKDPNGLKYSFSGNSSGTFKLKNKPNQFGSCEIMLDEKINDDLPSSDKPIVVNYSYINIEELESNLEMIRFETSENLHNNVEQNKHILVVRNDQEDDYENKNNDYSNNNQEETDQKIYPIINGEANESDLDYKFSNNTIKSQSNYNKNKKIIQNNNLDLETLTSSFNVSDENSKDIKLYTDIDQQGIIYLPALECEVGPTYTAQKQSDQTDNQIIHKKNQNKISDMIKYNSVHRNKFVIQNLINQISILKKDLKNNNIDK